MADELKSSADLLYEQAQSHFDNENNPHKVEKSYIHGLWNVDNTSDLDKPITLKEEENLNLKVNKADIYNSLENDNAKDLSSIPLSAAQGKVLAESISALSNIDETVQELDSRITALENWE